MSVRVVTGYREHFAADEPEQVAVVHDRAVKFEVANYSDGGNLLLYGVDTETSGPVAAYAHGRWESVERLPGEGERESFVRAAQ